MAPSQRRPSPTRQQSLTPHYQTFPTKPPASRGKPPHSQLLRPDTASSGRPGSHSSDMDSPLPKGQLLVLAIIALAEQTALNSISPYLPDMASTFPEVKEGQVGLYVGLIASSFALAQFATNFFWGWLSDRIGRKPVVLMGTFLTACCFLAFGFCRTLWQAILVQVFMGLVNGNQAVVSTCLGEITDRSNQSKAFTYLPVVYGIGGITGPVIGGLLVSKTGKPGGYPYLAPNLVSAAVLIVDLIITMIFLEESLEEAQKLPPLGARVNHLFSSVWQFMSSSPSPTYTRNSNHGEHPRMARRAANGSRIEDERDRSESGSEDAHDGLFPSDTGHLRARDVLNRDTILLLATFLLFQLCNISYNSLYPIFAQAKPPTGRGLSPEEIGISLGFAGLVTIFFQVGVFGRLREKIGNKTTYRAGFCGFVVAFWLMPFVGYKRAGQGKGISYGKGWLWLELGVVLIIKTVAGVATLTSALLLITNSARDHSVLGTLNGLAQTLSAAGRAIGPFVSGSLFSASTHVQPKGEALAFGIFGGIALVGGAMSLGIRSGKLEADEGDEQDGSDESGDEAQEEDDAGPGERRALLNGRK